MNGRLLLEAGTVTSVLTWEEQLGVTEVCVSHIHLDHVKELAFLVDNRAGRTPRPLVVTGVAEVVAGLRRHLFNDRIWPDFTRIPSRREPALALPGHPRGAVLAGLRALRQARAGQPPGPGHGVHPARAGDLGALHRRHRPHGRHLEGRAEPAGSQGGDRGVLVPQRHGGHRAGQRPPDAGAARARTRALRATRGPGLSLPHETAAPAGHRRGARGTEPPGGDAPPGADYTFS